MPLDKYQSMRDFEKTAEPSGASDATISEHERSGKPRFVVQEHHATALHWDFRLERDGVLVSWAVPKGIPPDPRVNNLAVHTEDHPLSYFDFAGEIPKGEYGGGMVHLWDQGTYEELKWSDREVMVVLHGQRARGQYVLFKTDGRNWMMHRMDPPEDPSRELLPDAPRPVAPIEVPTLDDVPASSRFLVAWPRAERVAVAIEGGRCEAWRADGKQVDDDWQVLRPFGRAVGSLPVVLVGQLFKTKGTKKDPGTFMIDDVVWIDGHGTTPLPFETRRSLLERIELDGEAWKTAPVYDDGPLLLDAARAQGWPGIYAIDAGAPFDDDHPPLFVPAGG
ncbi:MAG TPA: DNA polymerase ligase N-terminal domain-containing protein [Acidimicrobiales bacterium]|jgi:DNA ligase D-like protein (predicted 3'-phosphoesterase)|nr:DNA polymerase ligase N-terminal domain-containing protein [Acidimicrobiales bacterium]